MLTEVKGGIPIKDKQRSWTTGYYEELTRMGWRFLTDPTEGGINSALIAAHDEQTPRLFTLWAETKVPVEISLVLVAPNTDYADLPIRVLSYAGSALNLASSLKEKRGINVNTLRVMSPCYSNIYANGGNLENQLRNAETLRRLVELYKNNYYPDFGSLEVTLDTGKPITSDAEAYLLPRVQRVQAEHPEIVASLMKVAKRYDRDGETPHLIDPSLRPVAYLLTHPPAWGYSQEEELFGKNGERRINFMPASELRYLKDMRTIEEIAWTADQNKQIATIISAKQKRAPYYPVLPPGAWGEEPKLSDLQETTVQEFLDRLRKYNGREEVLEVMINLNQIKADTEQGARRRKDKRLERAMNIGSIIEQARKA